MCHLGLSIGRVVGYHPPMISGGKLTTVALSAMAIVLLVAACSAKAIEEQTGFAVDRKVIDLEDQHIRTLGAHMVTVKPHADVSFPVNIEVVAAS